MSETPKNLTGAINVARLMHREEIEERKRRRQAAELAKLDELNAVGRTQVADAPPAPPDEAAPAEAPIRPAMKRTSASERDMNGQETQDREIAIQRRDPGLGDERARPSSRDGDLDRGVVDGAPGVVPLERETLPSDRFVKVRNSIFDELSGYLTGNQYKIYLELYRETLGRKAAGS